jgi:CRISPR-associated protein Csb1
MNLDALHTTPRLLVEADLQPVQGTRFQPTGFPDLGAAEYRVGDRRMLLVESAQSMANRLEAACWDEAAGDLVAPLRGLPYVKSRLPDGSETTSILEAHRLNSPYIVNSPGFETIKEAVGFEKDAPFDRRRLAQALMRFDPGSLLHGVFLEKVGGVVRLPRALSAFIEASEVDVAASGGVKIDRVQPSTEGESTAYGKASEGYGNVPFPRDEYAAERITAYFNLDLALLRGLGLGRESEDLLVGLALYKVRRLLRDGLRLRTACDLDAKGVRVTRPEGFALPELGALESALPGLLERASGHFGEPRVLVVEYARGTSQKSKKKQ